MPVQYAINEKMKEAAASVLPVTVIVAVLCLALVPVDTGLMLSFLIGSLLLIVGMGLFTLGADMSMSRIGNLIGAKMTKSRRLWLILALSFVLGAAITIAEPDLQVLATNVPAIDKTALVLTVSVGVGLFLMICMARILFRISLRTLLIVFYALVFLGAFLSDRSILSVAFDSGGVTTGPMTVPFIMALGVGVASIRSDEDAKADSFGLVALCSIGPVAAVLLLGAIYQPETDAAAETVIAALENTVEMGGQYLHAIPEYMGEVAVALLPIFAFFLVFQVVSLHLRRLLMNIISNAVKYNRVGGEIRLGCCEKPSADPETAQIEFTCADTGIGMSEEFQKHVFEPFAQERNTARSEYGGTGLGMPIAKSLAEKMGGTLSFVSRQGVGTTFTLSLPFRICHAPEKRNKPKRLLQTSSIAGLHVLVAEDNRMNMEIAEFVLNVEEAFIIKAVNGEEAVRIFADSRPGEIDAILMDVMMPVMDGLEATRRIRAMKRPDARTIPIIAMTANAFAEDRQRAFAAGMDMHIAKPLEGSEMVETLERFVKSSRK